MSERKELQIYNCDYIMNTQMVQTPYIVEKMIYQGLYILAGVPKIGKSWLALELCLSVAEGDQFLKHETNCGQALYLSLEDSLLRLQNRLYEFTDETVDNLSFAIMAESIGSGLEEQIENAKQSLPDLKIVVIDTLQKIRESTDLSYSSDYKELSVLKNLADKLGIAILLVYHTRKNYDSDPFNMISGTTGLSGCVDGSFVLVENKRGSRKGKLYCVGRDIENLELNVAFENHHWVVTDEVEPHKRDTFPLAIHDLMLDEISFRGSATELCKMLYRKFGQQYFSNRITRDLVQHTEELRQYGVLFRSRRSHGSRIIELDYNRSGDSSDGNLVYVEVTDSTVSRGSENVCIPLISLGDGKTKPISPQICPPIFSRASVSAEEMKTAYKPTWSVCGRINKA